MPVARLGDALPIMADVALRPTFPEAELKRVREELLTSLLEAAGRSGVARSSSRFRAWSSGRSIATARCRSARRRRSRAFTVADLRQFHAQHYVPSNAALIVTGDVTAGSGRAAARDARSAAWKGAPRRRPHDAGGARS